LIGSKGQFTLERQDTTPHDLSRSSWNISAGLALTFRPQARGMLRESYGLFTGLSRIFRNTYSLLCVAADAYALKANVYNCWSGSFFFFERHRTEHRQTLSYVR